MRSDRRAFRRAVGHPAGAESLEGRSLPSHLAGPAAAGEQITIQVPSAYISGAADTLDVTLRRSVGAVGRGAAAAARAQAMLAQPLTVELSMSTTQLPGGTDVFRPVAYSPRAIPTTPLVGSASAGASALPLSLPESQATTTTLPSTSADAGPPPVEQSATFPAGVSSITVSVPIPRPASPTGNAELAFTVPNDSGSQVFGMIRQVAVLSFADAIPPTITDVHLIPDGRKATAISMTFSKAMNPASVQDVGSYSLTPNFGRRPRPIALKAAVYDSATDTVILTPKGPLDAGKTYELSTGRGVAPSGGSGGPGPLVDLQGNGVEKTDDVIMAPGVFSITVGAKQPYSAPAPVLWSGD